MTAPCVLLSLVRPQGSSGPSGPSLRALHRLLSVRRVSSRRQMDHLQRTAAQSRHTALYPAQVCGLTNESDTVKRLRLAVHPEFSFKAGQWVDLFIPGLETVGGFSMCSSPGLLQREGIMELAVKYAKHPPAHWVHTQCTTGSKVALRVGGDFFFDPAPSDPTLDLLLVGGGVGINPLYSILLHAADRLKLNQANISSAHICYSAKKSQDLLFKSSIVEKCEEFPNFSCDFHVTQQSSEVEPRLQPFTSRGRITADHLQAHVHPQSTLCYLCGPPPMTEALSSTLRELGLPKDRILFEKWW
ncbi:oxidoreductase NAD-binding domain-containing protein 1 isoform X2 [Eucyclogobius newberryi]|uniref:oxidoreductase NAD-binding domain-containing protein 1 isoform X2 n=1 Tax=Eucyclogobius newberryi TaxID=166745 RepID=UPI003B5A0451